MYIGRYRSRARLRVTRCARSRGPHAHVRARAMKSASSSASASNIIRKRIVRVVLGIENSFASALTLASTFVTFYRMMGLFIFSVRNAEEIVSEFE